MDSCFKIGDRVYIVANGINVQSFEITRIIDGFYTLRGIDNYSFIRLRKHRLFRSFDEAMIALIICVRRTSLSVGILTDLLMICEVNEFFQD